MRTTKLIIGIVSMVLTIVIFMQSCVVSFGDAVTGSESTSGGAGVLVALFMLISGIVAVATRSSRGGGIFCTILYALAGLVGIANSATYPDLQVWGVLSLVFALLFLVSSIKDKRQSAEDYE